MHSIGTPLVWTVFLVGISLALVMDLLMLRRTGPHQVGAREALAWSAVWIGLALAFNGALWWYLRGQLPAADANRVALEFLTGYLVEKALAVDNIFVFLMLFNYFAVPAVSQQRVLVFGVLGAIVLRALMILVGAALIARFHWLLYLFGLFLLATGGRMLWAAGQTPSLDGNPVLRWITSHLPLSRGYHGEALWLGERGRRRYTPLFVVLLMIGVSDVIFAVDSIPAIFAITTDPFVVLSSNIFAVLGLRALYFLLAGLVGRFHLLSYGLAAVLAFIGAKMLLMDLVKIPIGLSLAVVALLIGAAMALSLWIAPRPRPTLE
jgi:tellurite resistance protein TerC